MKSRAWRAQVFLGAVAATALVACSGSGNQTAGEPGAKQAEAASSEPAESCDEQTRALAGWIDRLLDEGAFPSIVRQTGVELIEAPSSADHVQRLPRAPVVVVSRDSVAFNGEHLADVREVAKAPDQLIQELLDRAKAELRARCVHQRRPERAEEMARLPFTVVLQLDRQVPWSVTRAVTKTLYQAGYDRVDFAVGVPPGLQPPVGSPELEAKLAAFDQAVLADRDDGQGDLPDEHPAAAVLERCTPLADWASKLYAVNLELRAAAFRDVPGLLARCECASAPSDVRALLWWWAGRRVIDGLVAGIPLPLAAAGAERVAVSAADDTPWSEAHRVVLEGLARGGQAFALRGQVDRKNAPSRAPFTCPK